MSKADEPAFPLPDSAVTALTNYNINGLTKREYFAATALDGLLSGRVNQKINSYEVAAEDAVCLADALIAELAKKQEEES